jgi:hypothetical protein
MEVTLRQTAPDGAITFRADANQQFYSAGWRVRSSTSYVGTARLVAVPEPASWLLTMIGVLAMRASTSLAYRPTS